MWRKSVGWIEGFLASVRYGLGKRSGHTNGTGILSIVTPKRSITRPASLDTLRSLIIERQKMDLQIWNKSFLFSPQESYL